MFASETLKELSKIHMVPNTNGFEAGASYEPQHGLCPKSVKLGCHSASMSASSDKDLGRVTRPTWLNASQKDRTRDSFHGTFLAVVHHVCQQKSQIPAVKQLGENSSSPFMVQSSFPSGEPQLVKVKLWLRLAKAATLGFKATEAPSIDGSTLKDLDPTMFEVERPEE
ncbi:uncharacterized protein HKW66_Vig0196700 [Vigna angularis]|uniref:Uncharacterized protein n=1 Tax=Phaseolus angularis TaxID=3914 RepID=A0A8T0KNK4_PHAAN|nr:uncharacterized protein HKW66_Vig0196700 [Vigna angularis]